VRTFKNLEQEKKIFETMSLLAADLEIKQSASETVSGTIEVSLSDFLKAEFHEQFMKLCNQKLEKGRVFLNRNEFARFLAAIVQKRVLESLPASSVASEMPAGLKKLAQELSKKLAAHSFKEFNFVASKNVATEALPDCIAKIYSDLLAGKNIQHLARFDLAVFLAAIGMPEEQIVNAFRKAPNFNEKTTRYQIKKIFQKKYKPVSCAKMREHGLNCSNCGYKHPLRYYQERMKKAKTVTAAVVAKPVGESA
jgi:DNA primase large subunit